MTSCNKISLINSIALLLLLLCIACQSNSNNNKVTTDAIGVSNNEVTSPQNILSEEEKAGGWALLFDGKGTDQWRGYHKTGFPEKGWGVDKEGNLYNEGSGGDLITKEKYRNFELQLDYMLSDTGNSGIFYFGQEIEEDRPIWHTAAEFQLLDNPTYIRLSKSGHITMHATADNYDMHSAVGTKLNPPGEWNHAKIIVNGNKVEHWLNDRRVVQYELDSPDWVARYKKSKFAKYPEYCQDRNGYIGLQDHGHLTKFRNIKIKRL